MGAWQNALWIAAHWTMWTDDAQKKSSGVITKWLLFTLRSLLRCHWSPSFVNFAAAETRDGWLFFKAKVFMIPLKDKEQWIFCWYNTRNLSLAIMPLKISFIVSISQFSNAAFLASYQMCYGQTFVFMCNVKSADYAASSSCPGVWKKHRKLKCQSVA